jgi:diguanylate cyclase (GGDEF)-like protein
VFPSVALFLQGRFRGFIWVIVLLVLTIILSQGAFGFDVSRYTSTFVSRIIAITLIISLLTCIPEYFRIKAERNLMLSLNDLESLTYGDLVTQLANRALLEKLLVQEFNRNRRYGSNCCVMMIEQDTVSRVLNDIEADTHGLTMLSLLAEVLRRNLRVQDVAGRWENNRFLLLLPESTTEGCKVLADRLLAELRAEGGRFGKLPLRLTASIGIAAIDNDAHSVLERVSSRLQEARRRGGNCYVAD